MSPLYIVVLGVNPKPPDTESSSISSIYDLAEGYLLRSCLIKNNVEA
jgi:hypothetical protein